MSGASNTLDFGAVTWDAHLGLAVSLFNKGQCAMPVQLNIVSVSFCFLFLKKNPMLDINTKMLAANNGFDLTWTFIFLNVELELFQF